MRSYNHFAIYKCIKSYSLNLRLHIIYISINLGGGAERMEPRGIVGIGQRQEVKLSTEETNYGSPDSYPDTKNK